MTAPPPHDPRVVFPLLADPERYRACEWDLSTDPARRAYWLDLFRRHFPKLLREAVADVVLCGGDEADARDRAAGARRDFEAFLDARAGAPPGSEPLDVLILCLARERSLRRFGFDDAYRSVKTRETGAALAVLPALLAELDALPPRARAEAIARGVFAGNIFDLGATQTASLFEEGPVDFLATRQRLRPRPWLVDDLDAWLDRLDGGPPYRAALLFVDNAGPDVVLGMLPLARDLLRRGTDVVLTANSEPALNDITHPELVELVERVARREPTLRDALEGDRLALVPSGNGAPLIDLARVSPELARAAADRNVDLVVLEGMGRALESNYTARLRCDALKIAMVKDPDVARWLGGEVYDLVLRFESGRRRPALTYI